MIHKSLWVGLLLLFLVTPTISKFNIPTVLAVEKVSYIPSSKHEIVKKEADQRSLFLSEYLYKLNSPMAGSAVDFVEAADRYQIDWTLLPSISGLESSYGKYIPSNSYNSFGWGHNAGRYSQFKNFKEGIFTVASGLRKNYIKEGPIKAHAIGSTYAESPTWALRVESIQNTIKSNYEKAH